MLFLADESCDFALVRALRNAGYDVKAVQESCPGESDETVIALSKDEERILLTEDKDFGQLVFSGAPSVGVLFIRYPTQARSKMPESILEFVKKSESKLKGNFVVAQPGRFRITSNPTRSD